MKKELIYPVLLVVVSLVAGVAVGTTVARRPRHESRMRFDEKKMTMHKMPVKKGMPGKQGAFERLSDRLSLSDDQQEKVKAILDSSRQEARETIEKSKDALFALREKTNTQIRAILSKDQQLEFDRMTAELKEHMEGFKERMHVKRDSFMEGLGPRCGKETRQ